MMDETSTPLQSAQLLQLVLDTIQPKVFWKDTRSVYLGCNEKFAWAAGLATPEEIVGLTDFDLPWTFSQAEFYRQCDRRVMHENRPEVGIIETQTNSDGELTWLETSKVPLLSAAGEVIGILGSFHDITKIKQAEQTLQRSNEELEKLVHERTKELQFIAEHDSLTNLLNRKQFAIELEHVISSQQPFALLFIDLDRFKSINDSLGHNVGDELLVQVSDVLKRCVPGQLVGRFGGDEFTVLLSPIDNEQAICRISQHIHNALSECITIGGSHTAVTASIGVTTDLEQKYKSAHEVLRDADIAMYEAKRDGKVSHRIFQEEMLSRASEQLKLEKNLRMGLAKNQFKAAYQPIVDVDTGRVRSFEALVRWKTDEGIIMPGMFLSLAESTGLIVDIGEQVLRQACQELTTWRKSHPDLTKELSISVNLSAAQISCPDCCDILAAVLAAYDLHPRDINLEITESMLLDDCENTRKTLAILHERGHRLLLDDFGTGYSSLSYLHRFKLDTLKIDRSFIQAADSDASSKAIIETIIGLAKILDLGVIAEGVETASQASILKELKCQQAQGFGYARPLAPEKAIQYLVDSPKSFETVCSS